MKKLLFLIPFLFSQNTFSQCYDAYYCIPFDDTTCTYHVSIDTVAYPGNIFQIGNSIKPVLDSTFCGTKVIITDTSNAYPVNNHSEFVITNIATSGDKFGFKIFSGTYYVQSDSGKDYGLMEISLDNGVTWYDLMDSTYSNNFMWWSSKPVLTGHTYTCKNFEVDLVNLISIQNFNLGDTILYRFSFLSDSIFDNLSGIAFDNICFSEFIEGISDIHFTPIKSVIFPNPSASNFQIEFENPDKIPFELAVYDICGKRVFTRPEVTENKIFLDCSSYTAGMYVYKLTDLQTNKRTWGRFNVAK